MKKLLFFVTLLFGISGLAQSIGIIGSATPTGWNSDTDMVTTDNVNYSITMTFVAGEAKFRANDAWTDNWGGGSFPSGTATYNGSNILNIPAGTFTVNFNITTLAYSFTGTPAFSSIGIWGPAVDSQNGFGGPDVDMTTTDGINYVLSAFNFSSGSAKFRKNDNNLMTYGSTGFPTGTAVVDGPNFYVPGGQYTVYFNLNTGQYSFVFPSVGYLGTVLGPNGFDGPDVNLTTTDGFTYTGSGFLEAGAMKFRVDDSWSINWGGDGLVGTAVPNGPDISIPTADNYTISFNKGNLDYAISPVLATNQFSTGFVNTYPNPTGNSWNITSNSVMERVEIINSIGKVVSTSNPGSNQASIDASGLASGIYFARVTTTGGLHTLQLIKE